MSIIDNPDSNLKAQDEGDSPAVDPRAEYRCTEHAFHVIDDTDDLDAFNDACDEHERLRHTTGEPDKSATSRASRRPTAG